MIEVGGDLHACTVEDGDRAIVEDLRDMSLITIGEAEFLLEIENVFGNDVMIELENILFDHGFYLDFTEGGQYAFVTEITD